MDQQKYERVAPTHYGIKHEPLLVTGVGSKRRAGQIVGFIGKQLCFFEDDGYIPKIGETVEVMITRPIFPKYTEFDVKEATDRGDNYIPHEGAFNRSRLVAILVKPVDPYAHQLMAIEGFECSGSMCRTTTRAVLTDGSRAIPKEEIQDRSKYPNIINLTPGRCGIHEANNVNAGPTSRQPFQELIPTNVYVEKYLLETKGTMFYIAGMTRVEDCEYKNAFKK